ncbi:IS21-like element helper ATPase IstB [Pseudogulbenkiania subflava]|uniref:DNA replication protein DnaC n=1 Tax=Pseudogulbenkiania subflava DSM 22618 TaxID=1123014 RepID=A0A1Y6BVW2_9NEIS|nr:IS21-like element helper ATPase IstB [Pseudogulbenkiania subflava]SMF29927.1 DNA replication protein DnaC [Pseudogulbenkiania subflava DSM 22618]
MLIEQTIDIMRQLRLHGMVESLLHQQDNPSLQALTFDDRLALMVEAERLARDNRRLARLLKAARLKVLASPEAIDYRASRGLDRQQLQTLLGCDWVQRNQCLIITGPTGAGKTWLACALGQQAARKGFPVQYHRFSRLLESFEIAREDGSLPTLRAGLGRMKLVILDDWGLSPLTAMMRQDLLEIIDDRLGCVALLITAQLPVNRWHDYLGEPTLADAILDRLVHSAHRIELRGESMRKLQADQS